MAVLDMWSWLNVHTILISAAIFLLISWNFNQRGKTLPPGPWSLPLIGCLPSLIYNLYRFGDEPEHLLAKMAARYGAVFRVNIGNKMIVVANGYKSISEAFQNPLLSDRPTSPLFKETDFDKGVIMTSGKAWKSQRKITLNIFRNFGVGKRSFEGSITTEALVLVQLMSDNKNHPFDPRILIGNCISNIICSVVFGKQYEHSDPEFIHILDLFGSVVHKIGAGGALPFIPILRYLFPSRYNDAKSIILEVNSLLEVLIKDHVNTFDERNLNDYIDIFLNAIERNKDLESSEYINHQALPAVVLQLFAAGTETTASTIKWALLYMIKNPEIQTKLHTELDTIIGRHRTPQWGDRSKLPYTEAVIQEVQRIRTVVPLGIPHMAAEDTKLEGYDIPKDSIIVSNIWAVHNDPDLWSDPDQFQPERFLDESGQFCPREELIQFSTGRRICLGENLARMELFIFFTHILHKFTIRKASPELVYSLKGISGITYAPAPFEIVAEIRE